ncbi:hypothetical protein [Phenylobacterium sp.]|uniref:hypothetical protein n=1 Tax=Phenylobacterium sp. TaxID=1871053 RepID=UPI0027312F42|nr:hypothetical protein [Phenylobacterium sp.]MDP1617481.1 hypothetical protein [Phenylobacterium sp.]MDP1986781.1 hypothetical protein [Phenylobacterium sp.]
MITYTDAHGQMWTLNLAACVPVHLIDEAGEPLEGARLDVCGQALAANPGLYALWANPGTILHHFGAGKRSLLAADWAAYFTAAPPVGDRWDVWRPVEPEEVA